MATKQKGKQVTQSLVIENAKIGFRNFSGKEGKFNPAGRRSFCVFIPIEDAEQLKEVGWNIKTLSPRDPDEAEQPYLQVSVSYDAIPPKIVLISGQGKTILDEESINILDWADITEVDLIVRPYNWEVNGLTGTKAYVKSMYVTIAEDEFERKYYDVPDSANNTMDFPDAD